MGVVHPWISRLSQCSVANGAWCGRRDRNAGPPQIAGLRTLCVFIGQTGMQTSCSQPRASVEVVNSEVRCNREGEPSPPTDKEPPHRRSGKATCHHDRGGLRQLPTATPLLDRRDAHPCVLGPAAPVSPLPTQMELQSSDASLGRRLGSGRREIPRRMCRGAWHRHPHGGTSLQRDGGTPDGAFGQRVVREWGGRVRQRTGDDADLAQDAKAADQKRPQPSSGGTVPAPPCGRRPGGPHLATLLPRSSTRRRLTTSGPIVGMQP